MKSILPGLLLAICSLPAWADPPQTRGAAPPDSPGTAGLLELQPAGQSLAATYYAPIQNQRDIDVMTLDLSRAWRLETAFELQERFTVFRAHGSRTDAPFGTDPDSAATGFAVGPALRLYFLDFLDTGRARPFVEGSAQFLFTPGTAGGFPAGGSGVNGFLRAGAGVLLRLRPRLAIEATYQWYSHVSNAAGASPQNPMWNGRGGSIALRQEF